MQLLYTKPKLYVQKELQSWSATWRLGGLGLHLLQTTRTFRGSSAIVLLLYFWWRLAEGSVALLVTGCHHFYRILFHHSRSNKQKEHVCTCVHECIWVTNWSWSEGTSFSSSSVSWTTCPSDPEKLEALVSSRPDCWIPQKTINQSKLLPF